MGARACAVVATLIGLSCSGPAPRDAERCTPAARLQGWTKPVSFSVLEDYDKGASLAEVARDFALMRELDVYTWRGSLGWDDYEPAPDQYDLAWLHLFADLAARHGIALRPYIAFTAPWAVAEGQDDQYWNDPPARLSEWYELVYQLSSALRRHSNVLSYEIYNEEDLSLWWEGTKEEYSAVLAQGAAAVRAADPDAEVLLGGLAHPDAEWAEALCAIHGRAGSVDISPFHVYFETWVDIPIERRRPDGRQVFFVWDETGAPTVDITLAAGGSAAIEHALSGMVSSYPLRGCGTLAGVALAPGQVRIFEILA